MQSFTLFTFCSSNFEDKITALLYTEINFRFWNSVCTQTLITLDQLQQPKTFSLNRFNLKLHQRNLFSNHRCWAAASRRWTVESGTSTLWSRWAMQRVFQLRVCEHFCSTGPTWWRFQRLICFQIAKLERQAVAAVLPMGQVVVLEQDNLSRHWRIQYSDLIYKQKKVYRCLEVFLMLFWQ